MENYYDPVVSSVSDLSPYFPYQTLITLANKKHLFRFVLEITALFAPQ